LRNWQDQHDGDDVSAMFGWENPISTKCCAPAVQPPESRTSFASRQHALTEPMSFASRFFAADVA
jgi:hypothetical protein